MSAFSLPKKKNRKPAPKRSINLTAINELNESLRNQPKFVRMIDYSVTCLCNMAVDDVCAEEIVEAGTIEVMMDIMAKNPGNEKVQALFDKLIANLSRNEDLARMIAERMNGNYDPFKVSVEKFSAPTVISSCTAVSALCKHQGNVEGIRRCGMVQALASAVTRFPDDKDVLAAIAGCMANFATDKESANTFLRGGAMPAILAAMNNHADNTELAGAGTKLLANLCRSGPDAIGSLQKMDAVDALVNVLDAHPFDEEIIEDATTALSALTGENDMAMLLQIIAGDAELDAKKMKAMSRLAALLLSEDNVDYLFKSGGIDTLLAVLKNALENDSDLASKIANSACRGIARALASGDEKNIYAIMKRGGVKMLLAAMKKWIDDEGVCESAILALAKMMTRKENAVFIGKSGGPRMVNAVLLHHPNSEPIAKAACDFYKGMGKWEESAGIAADNGSLEALVELMRNHPDNPDILESALQAIDNLASTDEHYKRLVDAGIMPLLMKALADHPEHTGCVSEVLKMIEKLAKVNAPDYAEQLEGLGAVGAIHNVMDANSDYDNIQTLGHAAIAAIQGAEDMKEQERLRLEELERQRLRMEEEERRRREEEERRRREEEERRKREAEEQRLRLAELARQEEQEMLDALSAMQAAEEAAELARLAALMEAQMLAEEEEKRKKNERLRLERERAERERMEREAQAAERARLSALSKAGMGQKKDYTEEKPKLRKNARDIFREGEDQTKKERIEFDPDIKEFLLAGMLLSKHSKKANPRPRHVYMTPDCNTLVWKDPKAKVPGKGQSMSVFAINSVTEGLCTPQLERKSMFGKGKPLAKEECAFAIFGGAVDKKNSVRRNIQVGERSVDLETRTVGERKLWIAAIEHLIEWAASEKLWGENTAQMTNNMMQECEESDED